jgi:hypothetical protein|tara:strand:- start:596 stop:769 length:174 start_codon:yes stop_codon:yes gene_type:complete
MAKSFRKFHEDSSYGGDEWGDSDSRIRQKDAQLQSRREQRRKKTSERNAALEPKDSE